MVDNAAGVHDGSRRVVDFSTYRERVATLHEQLLTLIATGMHIFICTYLRNAFKCSKKLYGKDVRLVKCLLFMVTV